MKGENAAAWGFLMIAGTIAVIAVWVLGKILGWDPN